MSGVEILASGMVTAVGPDAPSSCAAIRGGIAGFEEGWLTFLEDRLLMAEVTLESSWAGREKLMALAHSAVAESMGAMENTSWGEVPLFLCVAEDDRPGRPQGLDQTFINDLQDRLGTRFHTWSRIFSDGCLGGVRAVDYSRRVLDEGRPYCLVVAVDSLLEVSTLEALFDDDRLLHDGNSDGFIPGEAAASVLVGPTGAGGDLNLVGCGYGLEPAPVSSGNPMRGDGLVTAFRTALTEADWTMADVDYRLTDLSGEQYGFKEATLALTRTLREHKEEIDILHPADCVGETGAAITPLLLGVAMAAEAEDYAPGTNILVHVGSDQGQRGVLLLEAVERAA